MYLSQIIDPGLFHIFVGSNMASDFKVQKTNKQTQNQQKKPQNKNMQVSWQTVFHVKLKFHTNLYIFPHFLVKLKYTVIWDGMNQWYDDQRLKYLWNLSTFDMRNTSCKSKVDRYEYQYRRSS